MTLLEQAAAAWLLVKANLTDRSVLDIDGVSDEQLEEMDAKQAQLIASVFRSAKAEEEKAIAAAFGEETGHR